MSTPDQEFFVSKQALAAWPGLPSCLANYCRESEPQVVGQFLKSLPEEAVDQLLLYARQAQIEESALLGLNLFSAHLASQEGILLTLSQDLSVYSRRFILMLQAHMLTQQGLLALGYDQLSMEAFDIQKVPLTPQGRERFAGISVKKAPPPN